jgi:hypothetical protein
MIAVHNVTAFIKPNPIRVDELAKLFSDYDKLPARLRIAIGIMHDAACAREPTNSFTQCYTALEILTEHLRPPSVLSVFYEQARKQEPEEDLPFQTKKALLAALKKFLIDARLPEDQATRITNYASSANSQSMIDVFFDYVTSLGLEATRKDVIQWKELRGSLIHAATSNQEELESMKRFQGIVRAAVLEELRRASNA